MNRQRLIGSGKKPVRVLVLMLTIIAVFAIFATSAAAEEYKGQTIAQVLGMDGQTYYRWLMSHENDTYYNTTPYEHADHRNPNGDCAGANGTLDTPGVPAMNCMGFVWHALYMPTKMSGGNVDLIPSYSTGSWGTLYAGYNCSRRYFTSKKELLDSGYAEPGDIIWMFVVSEFVSDDANHIAIYMGDGHSDRVWHAVSAGCEFGEINPDYEQYLVIKSGAVRKLDTPVIKSVTNDPDGPKITWGKVTGASRYRVFVKVNSKWKAVGDTNKTYFVDESAANGGKYTYTVRCIDVNGKYISDYNKNGMTGPMFYRAPDGLHAECSPNRVTFSWDPVDGASKYRVYRKTLNGQWTIIAKTAATTYTDTIIPGGQYLYTVRTLDKNDQTVSAFRPGVKAYYVNGIPKISDSSVGNNGLTLTWNKVAGAEKYMVFKKVDGSWKRIGTSDTNSFLYKTPDHNAESTYTVRCVSSTGNAYVSGYDRAGVAVMFQIAPPMNQMEALSNGVKMTMYYRSNVSRYRVYRKEGTGGWKALGDTTNRVFIDTTAQTGKSYTYTLRCVSDDGKKLTSGFNTKGWVMNYAAAPKVSAAATKDGIKVSWNSVKNGTKYRVFIKENGKWRGLQTVKATEYLYKDVTNGGSYTFTVRCIDSTGWFNSSYNSTGVTATFGNTNAKTTVAGTGVEPTAVAFTEALTEAVTERMSEAVTEAETE